MRQVSLIIYKHPKYKEACDKIIDEIYAEYDEDGDFLMTDYYEKNDHFAIFHTLVVPSEKEPENIFDEFFLPIANKYYPHEICYINSDSLMFDYDSNFLVVYNGKCFWEIASEFLSYIEMGIANYDKSFDEPLIPF